MFAPQFSQACAALRGCLYQFSFGGFDFQVAMDDPVRVRLAEGQGQDAAAP
jgi:hypothetical protein